MGLFSGIGDAIGGIADAVGGAIGGVTDVIGDIAGGISDITSLFSDNPILGGLLSMVFPGAGAALAAAGQFSGMLSNVADMVGGDESY